MSFFDTLPKPEYCERLSNGLFAEPLNLSTNLFFLFSAGFAQRKLNKTTLTHRVFIQYLIIMLAVISVGSAAFHAFPNHFTLLLDAVPVYIFAASALTFLLKNLLNVWAYAIASVLALISLLIVASIIVPASFLNGSIRHIIILLSLIGLLYLCYKKYDRLYLRLLPILLLYSLAITARSIDQVVCSNISFGTHFIWHTLNAIAGYFIVAFLIQLDAPSKT